MGQANRRGTFEERRQMAIEKREADRQKRTEEAAANNTAGRYRSRSKAALMVAIAASLASNV